MFHVADCCWFGGRFIYWFQHQAVLEGPGFSHFCTFSERLVKMEESNLRVEIVRRVDFGQDRQRNTISGKAAVALHSCYSIFWFMRSTFLIGGVDIPPPRSCLVLLSYFAWLVEILDHCFFMWGDWLYVTTVCGSTVNWNALSFGIVVGCFMLQQLFCVIIWMKIESV